LKTILSIYILLSFTCGAYAQRPRVQNNPAYDDKPLHFGFTLSLNTMDFYVRHNLPAYSQDTLYANVSKLLPGFNVGIVSDLKLARYWNIRFLPGIGFGQRDLIYYKNKIPYDEKQRIESSFLEFPLLLKYKAKRINNFRPYLIAGINYRIDMASRKAYDPDKEVYVRLKTSDLYHEEGFGIDFYLPYFKLTTELKVSTGFRNILIKDPAADHPEFVQALQYLRSQIWILSFHFE
jgi:hypothetical protein